MDIYTLIYDPSLNFQCETCSDKPKIKPIYCDYFSCLSCSIIDPISDTQQILCDKCAEETWSCKICNHPLKRYTQRDLELLEEQFNHEYDRIFSIFLEDNDDKAFSQLDKLTDLYVTKQFIIEKSLGCIN